ncbi:hypothetical protein T439DRAFT_381939 [Meredithblackwellia eburnea MCA 4105]
MASSSRRAASKNKDTGFDPIGTFYNTREDFIQASSANACSLGFKLYIGGERMRQRSKTQDFNRLELACYKFRQVGADGRRTRVGGCHFALRARETCEEDADGNVSTRWELTSGTFEHNHPLGAPIENKARRKARSSSSQSLPPAKRSRPSSLSREAYTASRTTTPDSILDSKEPAAHLAYPSPADTPTPSIADSDFSYMSQFGDSGPSTSCSSSSSEPAKTTRSILLLSNEGTAKQHNGSIPEMLTPEAFKAALDAIPNPPLMPSNPNFSVSSLSSSSSSAASASIPIYTSAIPSHLHSDCYLPIMDQAALLVKHEQEIELPLLSASQVQSLTARFQEVQSFLACSHPELEHLAPAFIAAGVDSLDGLLALEHDELALCMTEKLPKIATDLVQKPSHVSILWNALEEERRRRAQVETLLALTQTWSDQSISPLVGGQSFLH